MWAKEEVNKPEFSLNNLDIEGSGPRLLHIGLNKQYYYLTNDDINGSKPNWNKFDTTRQPSNPLNPVYKLQSFTYVPPEAPKFIRDAMGINDIEGTRPVKKREFSERDTLLVTDIPGAKSRGARMARTFYKNIDYNDVTRGDWQSNRVTNPLDPRYTYKDAVDGIYDQTRTVPRFKEVNSSYGFVAGSKPAGLPAVSRDKGVRNLKTQDIDGAQANTKNKGPFTWC